MKTKKMSDLASQFIVDLDCKIKMSKEQYLEYERFKDWLEWLNVSPEEYEARCKEYCESLGV